MLCCNISAAILEMVREYEISNHGHEISNLLRSVLELTISATEHQLDEMNTINHVVVVV